MNGKIEMIILALLGFLTMGITATILVRKELLAEKAKVFLWFVGAAAAIAAGLNSTIAVIILALFFIFTVVAAGWMSENREEKILVARLGEVLALPASLAIIVDVISRAVRSFGKGEMLYWLIAPALYYLSLVVYSRNLTDSKKKSRKKLNLDFVPPLIATVVLAGLAVAIFAYSKGVIK